MSRGPSGTSQGPVLGPSRRGKVHGYLWLEKNHFSPQREVSRRPYMGLSSAIFGLGYNLECPDSQTVHLPPPTACCPIQRVTAYHHTLRERGAGKVDIYLCSGSLWFLLVQCTGMGKLFTWAAVAFLFHCQREQHRPSQCVELEFIFLAWFIKPLKPYTQKLPKLKNVMQKTTWTILQVALDAISMPNMKTDFFKANSRDWIVKVQKHLFKLNIFDKSIFITVPCICSFLEK